MVETLLRTAAEAAEHNGILDVQINIYYPTQLPGFDEDGHSMKSPHQIDED